MNNFSKESLRVTLNLILAYTWCANRSGALTFLNQRSAEYLGLAKDDPLRFGVETGAAWDSHIPLLHPDDHDPGCKFWSGCIASGSAGEATFRIRNAEGQYRWHLIRAEPLLTEDGVLQGWIGINIDIDERKQAEFYLAEAERVGRSGSWAFNDDGFEYWSSGLFQIHGLDPDGKAPSTQEYLALVHPEDRDFVALAVQQLLTDQIAFEFTKRIVRPDGEIRHMCCVGTPVANDRTSRGYAGIAMDVTEQEQLTQALRTSEEELQQILDLLPQLVAVFGPGRKRLYANRMTLAYFDVSLEDWRQRRIESDIHPHDIDRLKAYADGALSNGLAYQLEVRLRNCDGRYRWFLLRYNPLHDAQGQVIRWYCACTDIEDRKRAEERLQQENVALREEIDKTSMFEEIVGVSPALTVMLSRVSKVATTDSTVLITGETGTGKELVARAIHKQSRRSSSAFVAVNCAAMPRELIASELFGHEKGAFTGATQRRVGRFELADGAHYSSTKSASSLPTCKSLC